MWSPQIQTADCIAVYELQNVADVVNFKIQDFYTVEYNNITTLCKEMESDHENILPQKRFSNCLEAKYLIKR